MSAPNEQELHDFVMPFGRHRGVRLVHVPVSYLTWMVGNSIQHADLAERELDRRGTAIPALDISGHAIDRASLLCRHFWHEERVKTGRGIHNWLVKVAQEALDKGKKGDNGKIIYAGMKFTFEMEGKWPVLLTIRPAKVKKKLDSKPVVVQNPAMPTLPPQNNNAPTRPRAAGASNAPPGVSAKPSGGALFL